MDKVAESKPDTNPARGSKSQPRRRSPSGTAKTAEAGSRVSATTAPASNDGRWYRIDLHIHTPASLDYQQPGAGYIDILRLAASQGIDIIAFTDHNSVAGFATLQRQIEDLELLERLRRLAPDEATLLTEYRDLLKRVLVLPGLELTATFGFHVLAIFPEGTSVRRMEHLLLSLNVPEERFGSGEVGATTDVLTAYRMLDEAGAIVIGAHANSTNGVAMRGVTFGGQTKIAYTQDPHLHALELTDLLVPAPRRSSARTWDGTRQGYVRRMHLLQGSDAHRLTRDPKRPANLGVGDRQTEVFLPERSFQALRALLLSNEFHLTRALQPAPEPGQVAIDARSSGPDQQTAFHELLATKRDGITPVMKDIAAFANGEGGTVYIGLSDNPRRPPHGVDDPSATAGALRAELAKAVEPNPAILMQGVAVRGKTLLSVTVQPGDAKPYVLLSGGVFVRRNGATVTANREELIALSQANAASPAPPARRQSPRRTSERPTTANGQQTAPARERAAPEPNSATVNDRVAPRTGVEIVDLQDEDGIRRYSMKDLRSDEVTPGVELANSRGLWRYAIQQAEGKELQPGHIRWKGNFGYWKGFRHRSGEPRHNLVYRDGDTLQVFFGVSEPGLSSAWREVLPPRRSRTAASVEEQE